MPEWLLDEADGRLRRGDTVVVLTPKAAAVLGVLVRRRGEVVGKREVIEAVWGSVHVKADIVREYVFDIRAALGDDAARPRYVETVRGRGFRLKGGVRLALEDAPVRQAPSERPLVDVAAPKLLFADERWRRWGEWIAEEVLADLTRHHAVRVRKTGQWSDEAREAPTPTDAATRAADYVLATGIAANASEVRVTFRLVCGRTGIHLWGHRAVYQSGEIWTIGEQALAALKDALGEAMGDGAPCAQQPSGGLSPRRASGWPALTVALPASRARAVASLRFA